MTQVRTAEQELQETEYRLPAHWLLRKRGFARYIALTDLMAAMIREAGIDSGEALDLGCGDGRGTFELQCRTGPSLRFRGIDYSARAIAFARLMAPEIPFEVGDANGLPYETSRFRLVVAREVLEHIPPASLRTVLKEICRILKPGGFFLITVPSKRRKIPPKHFQHFDVTGLDSLLTAAGFVRSAVRGFGWWPSTNMEGIYRRLMSLPGLWRVDVWLGCGERDPARADQILYLAQKPAASS